MTGAITRRITIVGGGFPPPGCPIGGFFPEDSYRDREMYHKLIVARTLLFHRYPFWGHLAMNLSFVEDPTGFVKTMATDARNIYYDAAFVRKYSVEELLFVVAHEIYHILSNHVSLTGLSRRGDRKPRRWNRAGDYMINIELVDMKCGKPPNGFPLCLDEKYRNWATEAIYDDLSIREESNSGGESDDAIEGEGEPLDIHIEVDPEDYDDLKQIWTDNALKADAAARIAEQAGLNSGASGMTEAIRRMIGNLHKPKRNWRAALRKFCSYTMRRGYSYARPNRSMMQRGIIVPGFRKRSEDYDLAIAIDTSGSITTDDLSKAMSEVLGLIEQLPSFRILIWCFDGLVREETVTLIDSRRRNGFETIRPFLNVVAGGGGTSFEMNWDYMKKNRIKPTAFVMITDGLPNAGWGDPHYCQTMFLIVGNQEVRAPFGQTLYYE